MANQLIPLSTEPNQTFQIALSVGSNTLRLNLTFNYNEMGNYWIMTIADVNNNVLLASVPLVTGCWPAANILSQYQYLNLGSAYVLNVSNNTTNDYPNATSLGTDFVLLWSDPTS